MMDCKTLQRLRKKTVILPFLSSMLDSLLFCAIKELAEHIS